jgi:DNA polymerase-3 subunit epsilon
MKERYVAFDVETPNCLNDRMSAIGVTVVEDGTIVDELYSLVDPEARFDSFNVRLTGITPEAVAGAPTFPELWRDWESVMSSGLLIAHNAPFDMSVLAKCLLDYGIRWRPTARYACTCRMGRRLMPELPNHRLDTMCEHLGLALDHHHAGSDSRACAELLLHYIGCGADLRPFVRTYDMLRLRTVGGR